MFDKLAVFCGNANPNLAKDICRYLKIKLGDALVSRFNEGEICVKINENVRGKDVFLIQPTSPPPNENMMELLIMIDALKRASARRITAVLPYYGYARQDRKDQPRVPITAKLAADLITVAGASRLLTVDLHAGQIQGFFNIPVDHLYAVNVFVEYYQKLRLENLVVVSPDVGGIKMARAYAKRFAAGLAIIDKRRLDSEKTTVMNVMGEVEGKNAIIVDDMVSTAGSLVEATQALKEQGAGDIYAAITHPVLSGPAMERIENCALKHLAVCDTIPVEDSKLHPKIKLLTVAPLLAEAIRRIHREESVSSLFD
ncbi:MAG: ribose-phosphate pyrophosphokinase [Candidatus Omnitrophica bacterium]|nr:ribose-phosphate pyrophosphokinase [Candidatus Omnitrophota bacterium]MBU3933709.1 ribose-phosphate pyrophosphokinase [Candidatus Omnitrophota bacterium]MBU4140424.1 ribose-phosphate pyrophosphokinase [Candidatus Omnitrophota bacterium]